MSAPLDLRAVDVWVHDKRGEVGDGREYVVALLAALRETRTALIEMCEEALDGTPVQVATVHRAEAVLVEVRDE